MQVRPKYAQGARSVPGTIADVPEGQPGTEQVPPASTTGPGTGVTL